MTLAVDLLTHVRVVKITGDLTLFFCCHALFPSKSDDQMNLMAYAHGCVVSPFDLTAVLCSLEEPFKHELFTRLARYNSGC